MIPGVTDIQPAALPGAYNATFGNGQSMLIHGPSAEELYNRYQANAPKPGLSPDATAQNDMGPPQEGVPDAPVRMGTTQTVAPQGGQAEQPPAPVTAAEGPHKVPGGASMSLARAKELAAEHPAEPPPPGQAPAQVPPAQMPGGQPRIGEPLGYSMKAVDPATGKEVEGPAIMTADGPRVYVGARAGSPGGPTKLGKEFGQHASETEQQVSEARAMQQQGMDQATQIARQKAEAEYAFAKEQEKQALIQQHDQEEENRQIQEHVEKLNSNYEQARDEYKNSKVDSGRVMRGNWLAVLGTALGAMAASLGKHENYAQNFVNQQIDRDVRQQEKEIEIKKDAANNALLELTRSQGSLQAGKLALRQILTEKALVQAQTLAGSFKSSELQANAQQLVGQLQEQHATQDLARKQSYVDKVMHDRVYYSPGSAGRSAGTLVPTLSSMAGRQEAELKGRELGLKQREMTLKEGKAAAQGAGGGAIPRGLLQQASSVQSVEHIGNKILSTYGVKPGEDVGYLQGKAIGAEKSITGESARTLESELPTLFREQYKVANGNPPTEGAEKEFREQISHWSTAQIINFANNAMQDARAKAKFIDSQRGKGNPLEESAVEGEPSQ